MPHHAIDVPETYLSITRKVTISVLQRLLSQFNLPNDTRINVLGYSSQSLLWNSTQTEKLSPLRDTEKTKFNQGNLLTVEVKEEPIDTEIMTTPLFKQEHPVVFLHEALDIVVRPVYTRTRLRLSCNLRTENREIYTRFKQELLRMIVLISQEMLFECRYTMILPNYIIAALSHAFILSEQQEGYGVKNLDEFLRLGSKEMIQKNTQPDGTDGSYTVQENQINLIGFLEDTTPPIGSKKDTGSNYEASFEFVMDYDKPETWHLFIPLLIHNQMIDEIFRPQPYYSVANLGGIGSNYNRALDNINLSMNPFHQQVHSYSTELKVPYYDDWVIKKSPKGYLPMASFLLEIVPDDKSYLLDFKDIDTYIEQKESLRRFYRLHLNDCFIPYESPILYRLYQGGDEIQAPISIDEQGRLRSFNPLDLRKVYHLRIYFLRDLNLLSKEAWNKLLNIPWFLDDYLYFLYPDYNPDDIRRLHPYLLEKFIQDFYNKHGRYPTQDEIDDYYLSLSLEDRKKFYGVANELDVLGKYTNNINRWNGKLDSQLTMRETRLMKTVMRSNVSVHRKEDNQY